MPVITSIKPQKNKKRVNIYLDHKFGFGIDLENYMKLRLKVEQELSTTDINKIVKKAEYKKTLDRLLQFASLRPRSEKEILMWMKRKKVHESLVDKLFDRLKYYELVGDEKFAIWWVTQRLEFRQKSKRELISELRNKGISGDIIKRVLEEAEIDENLIAKKLIEKRGYKWENMDKKKAVQKKSEFLARKGFSWDVIKRLLQHDD